MSFKGSRGEKLLLFYSLVGSLKRAVANSVQIMDSNVTQAERKEVCNLHILLYYSSIDYVL